MKVRISFWQRTILLVGGCLWNTVVANTGELICQEDGMPGELQCSFQVDTTKPMKDHQLKHCTDDICVTAVASMEDRSAPPIRQTKIDNDTNEDDQDDTLKVGMATYRKPFGDYYSPNIALWLHQAPKTLRMDGPLEWANWCSMLGGLHVRDYKGWYDLELAINALQESIQLVQEHFKNPMDDVSTGDDVWDGFLASVYSNLGEAYYLDPDMKHGIEALDHYEKALAIYQSLVQKQEAEATTTAEHETTRHVYSMTLAKVGSALIQLHSAEPSGFLDSIDHQDLDGTMTAADKGSTTTTISNFNNEESVDPSHRGTKLQRASEVLVLAMEFYQSQCQKQLPNNHNDDSSGQEDIPDPSTYVEACVDYATTLQYAATVESLSGNHQEALEYMKRALLVYTCDKEILHTESASVVDAVLADAYSMWYHMGSTESIGSMLVNIADTCGQLGKHEESKRNYKLAMRFYSNFHVRPPSSPTSIATSSMNPETKAVLDNYVSMLKEYRRGTGSHADPPLYQRDDMYEGDILYNIGSMYIHAGDEMEGMEWFEEAIAVYQRTHKPGSFAKDHQQYSNRGTRWSQIASMKATLTRLYFQQSRFDDSIRVHQESMDLFRDLYGDGVNPYMQFLQEQVVIDEHGGMIGSDSTGGINLESYLQSIKNATEKKLEALNEEEKKKKEEL